ncbi:MAG: hypothetical protein OXC08_20790 [Thiotrichales bacterium]|nr:hypothetical protein [Thiotrichales bacterium]
MSNHTHALTADARELLAAAGCEIEISFAGEGYEVTHDGELLDTDGVSAMLSRSIPEGQVMARPEPTEGYTAVRVDGETGQELGEAPEFEPLPLPTSTMEALGLEEVDDCDLAGQRVRLSVDRKKANGLSAEFVDQVVEDVADGLVERGASVEVDGEPAAKPLFGRTGWEAERHLVKCIHRVRTSTGILRELHITLNAVNASNPNVELKAQLGTLIKAIYGGDDNLVFALGNAESALKLMRLALGLPVGEDPQ